MSQEPLRIDIVSDVMCPWCVVGYNQLAKAVEATNTPVDIHWHPFELNPNMPVEGQNLREHLNEKYGVSEADSRANRERLTEMGAELGFEFSFADDMKMYNTFNTHQLLHWAGLQDRNQDLKQALFTAHFTHRRDLSDVSVLADIASEIGLDRDEAVAVLEDQRFAEATRTAQQFWTQQGISGVPAMVFNRKHLVTGAQGVHNYKSILDQLTKMAEEAAE